MEPDDLVGASEVGRWVDLHQRQVRGLASKGIIERDGNGLYLLRETVRHIVVSLREAAAGRGRQADSGPDLTTERALLARSQREAQDRANAKSRGDLASLAEVETAVGAVLANVRTRILGLPNAAAPLLVGLDSNGAIEVILTRLVHDALSEIACTEVVVDAAVGRSSSSAAKHG